MKCVWLALMAVLAVEEVKAAVTASVGHLSITNPSDYLIAADALTDAAGTDRDAVQVRSIVNWSNNGLASVSATTEYQLRLLTGGSAVNIVTESGKPGTIYRFTNSVSVPGSFGGGSASRTNVFPLKPAAQLDPFAPYLVELTLFSAGRSGDTAHTTTRRFWHFTNLISGDAAFNALGEMTGGAWEKTYALETSPDQNKFEVSADFRLLRFDDFDALRSASSVPVRLTWRLENESGDPVATTPASTNFNVNIFTFDNGTPRIPDVVSASRVIAFRPDAQLDSVHNRFRVVVTLAIGETPGGAYKVANSTNTPLTRPLHFNGALQFGPAMATLTNIVGTPGLAAVPAGQDYLVTSIDGRAAFTQSFPGASFDIGGPRGIHLHPDGSITLASGTISPFPLGNYYTNANVRFHRGQLNITPDGVTADIRAYLPAGFGVTTNYGVKRALESQLVFQDVRLNSSLEPQANLVKTGTILGSSESKPIWFVGERFEWNVISHRFILTPHSTFPQLPLRAVELAQLRGWSDSMASPAMAIKRANDGYYQHIRELNGSVTITASVGNVALVDFRGVLDGEGSYTPHFPMGPTISWSDGGGLQVMDNRVAVGANSRLQGVGQIIQQYVASCAGCDETPTTNSLRMTPDDGILSFTRDGGVVGTRLGGVSQDLRWGLSPAGVAHQATAATNLAFLAAGHFLRGADNSSSSQNGPGVIHITGVVGTNPTSIERPGSDAYNTQGNADYAGMNVRSEPAETSRGRDVITGTLINFQRTRRAKYYARLGGVSGIHEAVSGSFDSTLTLLGYPFTFTKYGFSFLDNQNIQSRTDGSVSVPYPSEFTLPFNELKITCAGGLGPAKLPANTGYRYLSYWNADILPQSISFEGPPGEECDPTQAYLVLGVNAHASYVAEALSGTMGFFANGTIIPPRFNLPGVSSRFDLPSQFRFSGPVGSGDWVLTPVAPAYFTTNQPSLAQAGALSVAGTLSAPFFGNMKVHLLTGARTNGVQGASPTVRLAGGWPRAGENNVDGWEISDDSYFTDSDFDRSNRGFPDGVPIDEYANSSTDQYRAVAQRNILDIIDLKYPLAWDPALRYFRSWKGITTSLFVVSVPNQLTYLDPKTAVIDIGARYDNLPVVTLAHLVVDENGQGAATAMRDAISASSYNAIVTGLANADAIFSENPSQLLGAFATNALDGVLNSLMTTLAQEWADAKAAGPNARSAFRLTATNRIQVAFNGSINSIQNRLLNAGDRTADNGGQLYAMLQEKISAVASGVSQNAVAFNGGANGADAIRKLVNAAAPEFNQSVAGPEVEAALAANASAFQQLAGMMNTAQAGIADFNAQLANQNVEWSGELKAMWTSAEASLRDTTTAALSEIVDDVNSINWRLDDPFAGDGAEQFRLRMRSAITDRLASQQLIANIRLSIKQRLYDLHENYRTAANSVFSQYNFIARDLISRQLATVDNNYSPGLGMLSDYFSHSRMQGHAEVQGDSLRELRLDARVKLKVPEDMAFNAYLQIKEQNSENTPETCAPPPGSTGTEIKIGATDVELDWLSSDLRADIGTKINLVDNIPTGFAGSLETTGPLAFGGFVIKKVGFAMAFGDEENYIAANARVALGRSSEVAGGLFFGRACDITPLRVAVASVSPFLLVNFDPEEIFGQPPFTGGFVYGEGMFPVFSLGCVLEVRMTAGAGGWYFTEGPRFGGLIKAGISGTVICVLSASGDITMIGSKKEDGMLFAGMAHVEGCFGIWPFEVCVDTSTAVKYHEGKDWDAEEP